MFGRGRLFSVVDNTGVNLVKCIHHYGGFQQRRIRLGDLLLVVVKQVKTAQYTSTISKKDLEQQRKNKLKNQEIPFKKGEILFGLVVYIRDEYRLQNHFTIKFFCMSVILIKYPNKAIAGTRIFGSLSKSFRSTNYMKVLSISAGVC